MGSLLQFNIVGDIDLTGQNGFDAKLHLLHGGFHDTPDLWPIKIIKMNLGTWEYSSLILPVRGFSSHDLALSGEWYRQGKPDNPEFSKTAAPPRGYSCTRCPLRFQSLPSTLIWAAEKPLNSELCFLLSILTRLHSFKDIEWSMTNMVRWQHY